MNLRRILFIGNSFTNRNDMPGLLSQLAASAHPSWQLETHRIIANGQALKAHWEKGEAREAIGRQAWDYVVLQEQSTLPLKNRQRMHDYVTLFDGEIKSRGARTVLYLTWTRQNAPDRQDELSNAYLSIGQKIGAIVVPVGVAWQRLSKSDAAINPYDRDKSHPNPAGSYLAACVFFGTLLHQNPIGLPALATGVNKLGSEATHALQQITWNTFQGFPPKPY